MTLSLVSMENVVSQGSMNSRQEQAEESEKLGNRAAAAAEPEQLRESRAGTVTSSYQWAFLVVTLHLQAAQLPWGFQQPTVAVPQVAFINHHPSKGLSPNHPTRPSWAPTTPPQLDARTQSPQTLPSRRPGTARILCH